MRGGAWTALLTAIARRSAAVGVMAVLAGAGAGAGWGAGAGTGAGSGIGMAAIFLIAAFLSFLPIVLRAVFVRSIFATAIALIATVFFAVLAGENENGVSSGLFFPKRL